MPGRLPRALSLLALFSLASLAFVARVSAQIGQGPLNLGLTNKLDYRRLDQDDAQEEAFRNRTELTAIQGILTFWMRLESLQVSDAFLYDPFLALDRADDDGRVDEFEITKLNLTVETRQFRGIYGDVAYVYGRGMMPSVFEDEELNFDTRLQGLSAAYDHRIGTGTMLVGSDEGNRFRVVYGEPAAWRPAEWGQARFGGAWGEAWGSGEDTEIRAREVHTGAYADVAVGPLSVFGEYVQRDFKEQDTSGYGAFVSAVSNVFGVTLSAEYKDFKDFEHLYHDPPTALRQHTWTMLNRESGKVLQDITDDDVRGALVEAEWSPDYFTTLVGSFSRLEREENSDSFWEGFGEAKGTIKEVVYLTAGAAESEFRFGNLFEERITAVGEIVGQFDDWNSLSVGVEWAEVQEANEATQDYEEPIEFREQIFYASYGRSPWLNLTVNHERSGDPEETRSDWTTVLAEISVGGDHDFLLSYGAERGGWKCTGGICFFEPEFEGFKLRWVSRF